MTTLGLVAEACHSRLPDRYRIGPSFLQSVSFLGCAPAVQFEPGQDQAFIHWEIGPCLATPCWRVDHQRGQPRCPHCRKRLEQWREQWPPERALQQSLQWLCPHCQRTSPLTQLDWRHTAGYARQFITVLNIYPSEAIPTEAMLTQLLQHTGVAWQYFYCPQNPMP
ncbi:MAG: hypothetical protein HY080_05000 [Gammaproteobacteria bacterium]|nr:hypothetical protein [Gammaproteobacteria bacterium]